jgi:hypothetical protein
LVSCLAVVALGGCGAALQGPVSMQPPPRPLPTATAGKLVLADEGIGGLGLGMTKRAALATGLVGAFGWGPQPGDPSGCETYHGKRGIDLVYFSAGKAGKLVIISVKRSIKTAAGIGIGDTYRQLHARYPNAEEGELTARVYANAPGAKVKAGYRFGMDSGDRVFPGDKIRQIALQADHQPCYE